MSGPESLVGRLAEAFTDVVHEVDTDIGENRTYGAGIGPHDEGDQIDALVQTVREEGLVEVIDARYEYEQSENRMKYKFDLQKLGVATWNEYLDIATEVEEGAEEPLTEPPESCETS